MEGQTERKEAANVGGKFTKHQFQDLEAYALRNGEKSE